MALRVAVAIGCCFLVFVGVASFVVSPGASAPDPADFDSTVAMGLTLEERQSIGSDQLLPRAQIAYSQYPYVVGYRGIELAAAAVDDPLVEQQFGYPLVVYVEAAPPDVSLDESGHLVGENTDEWTGADEAHFVTGSDARTAAGPTPVAFADRAGAEAFASEHGGSVVRWDERARFDARRSDGSVARDRIESQHIDADERVDDATDLLDRPTETVVGEDEPTLRAAPVAAEPNTTIRLPPGTYDGPIEITKPVTIVGEEATVVGDDNGTVVTVTADDVAVSGDSIGDGFLGTALAISPNAAYRGLVLETVVGVATDRGARSVFRRRSAGW